jgi:hypothetical protein
MGRGNLSRAVAFAAVALLLLVSDGSAATTLPSRLIASGTAVGGRIAGMQARIALSRSATASFAGSLTPAARAKLAAVDFSRSAAVAVFGEFGCRDSRVSVGRVDRSAKAIAVHLVERPLPPGTVECMAIFETFRLLTVPRSSLGTPAPTRAAVTLRAAA